QDLEYPPKQGVAKTVKYVLPEDSLTTQDKAKIKRFEFIQALESKGVKVEPYKGVVSRLKKTQELLGIAYSGEKSGSWFLGLPQMNLSIMVLLCLRGNNDVHRVILPRDFCDEYRDFLSTSGGQYKFSVKQKGEKLLMYTKKGNVDISQYIDNYAAFL
ncbi:MAG TPA: hypothetical protein PKA39_09670, partial [Ignavibacteria bacterium]|nr:hypothetical protein [Ignavibacteria bacterium]